MDIKLLQGDCLELIQDIPCGSIDLVLTDPPYSSGGLYIKDRQKCTSEKYTDTGYNGASRFPDFSGDNMDQHSFTEFMRRILFKCRKKAKPGGDLHGFHRLAAASGNDRRFTDGWMDIQGNSRVG